MANEKPDADSGSRNLVFLGLAVFVTGLSGLIAFGSIIDPLILVLGTVFWISLLGVLLHPYVSTFFGPVLWFDLIRTGRRRSRVILRTGYAVLLVVFYLWVCINARNPFDFRPGEIAQITNTFFTVFLITQTIVIFVITPGAIAGCITDEKERRTMEFILATDLHDREILFGKFLSRMGGVILFVISGLPILAMLQFFGGIDSELMMIGMGATIVTIISLAAVSVLSSVLCRKTRDAMMLSYLLVLLYLTLSSLSYAASFTSDVQNIAFDFEFWKVTGPEIFQMPAWGNPFLAVAEMYETRTRAGSPAAIAGENLKYYAGFHAVIVLGCLFWASRSLRKVALAQAFGGNKKSRKKPVAKTTLTTTEIHSGTTSTRPSRRPEIGEDPILWKEIFVDTGIRSGWFLKLLVWLAVVGSFLPIPFILYNDLIDAYLFHSHTALFHWRFQRFHESMNIYARVTATIGSTLLMLAIVVRASGVISSEREKHTLDVLLTTPMSSRRILWGKWWGCLLGMRWGFAWIFAIWLVGLGTGSIHPLGFVACVIELVVFSSTFAWLGILCSVRFQKSLFATLVALMGAVFLMGGYFIVLGFCCFLPLNYSGGSRGPEDLIACLGISCSPPAVLGISAIRELGERELEYRDGLSFAASIPICFLGWLGLWWLFMSIAVAQFRKLANRGESYVGMG